MSRYAELHCHTNFSFLDGASHPHALVERAAELGYRALAVTDHDGFYGAARFRVAAAEVGLPTVYGVEVGLPRHGAAAPEPKPSRSSRRQTPAEQPTAPSRRGRIRRMHGSKPIATTPTDHLVLLAPHPAGYGALSHLVTRAQFRGEKDRPVYDMDELAEAAHHGDLVALTGCHRGAVPSAAVQGDLPGAMEAAARLREVFAGRLHVELWDHRMPEDDLRNGVLAEVAARLRLPTVATNNVHYHDRSEADIAEVLAAVGVVVS